jgi:Transmembrane amino acid transporter protein
MASVLIVMVHVGVVQPHPNSTMALPQASFKSAMTSTLNIVLAYSGHVTYFGFFSELKDPKDFKKSLVLLQTTAISVYTIVAVVIYYYVGPNVRAPALSSASQRVAKIAYGVAIPTIVIAGVLNAHVASMAIYKFVWGKLGKEDVYKEKTMRAWVSWISIVFVVWFLAWVIAESIPIFEYLLALVSALFSGWYSCK